MTEVPLIQDVSGVYTTLFLDTDLLKMALRARKACGAFEKRAPGWGHCGLFLGKARYSHTASLHPGLLMGTSELLGKPKKMQGSDLRWTSIPSRGSRKYS